MVGAPAEDSSLTGVTPGIVDETASANGAANSGAAYVFVRSGAGVWSQHAYVKASNTGANDHFGNSVALSGDGNMLAVAAPFEASALTGVTAGNVNESTAGNGALFAGAVYVYARSGSTWLQQAYVKASNTDGDAFGSSIALNGDGNTLAVGAPFESSALTGVIPGNVNEATAGNGAPFSGAVYMYLRSAGTWSQQAYVKASNTAQGDNFGTSVAVSGDGNTLAVGAPAQPTPDSSPGGAGAAYVYTRSAGTWSQQALVKASNPQAGDAVEAGDNFGGSVALSGDGNTLVVGAQFEDGGLAGVIPGTVDEATAGNDAHDSGAVYVYKRTAGTWSQETYVKSSNTGADDNFGNSVALSSDGNTLAIGAQLEDGGGTGIRSSTDIMANPNELTSNAGAVYLY